MQVLGEAIECDPSEREAWLSNACAGDEALYKEVLRLMSHEKTAVDFMEESPFEELLRQHEEASLIGRHIGPYEITRELGRGGMGAVYLARRSDEQYKSLVAIKVIKRGMDTDEILRSFRNERQILAYLNHPNIAKLLDGGTTTDGLSYFIMEYIKGQPIKQYCDEKRLSIEDRLKLFRQVCSAVQYAHQNLIVHRDLKPSNILVTADGVPKLLDFGIAKILWPNRTEETATQLRAMTPEYASPEQVRGERVTTASDIYSLGVILYELLTGRRPFRFKGRTQAEVAGLISTQEPHKPSTAVSHEEKSGDDADHSKRPETASSLRDATPAELSRRLRGDLDNIVLKAMRKEQERRYASVEQFAEDIERHLAGLPVRARKDTFSYRASKFIQRNRVGVAAAALILLTLVGGIIATAWEAHVARKERAIAEERFNEVRQMAHAVMFDYHDAIASLPGSTPVRERMVKDSLKYLDKLSQQASDDRNLQREIASAYFRVGDVQGRPFYANLGDLTGALESYRKSLDIRQRLAATDPTNAELRGELGASYERIGRLNIILGNPAVAMENLQKAATIYEEILRTGPTNRPVRGELGLVNSAMGIAVGFSAINSLGDRKGAMEYQRKAVAILEPLVAEEPTNIIYSQYLSGCYLFIGSLQQDDGHLAEALDNYRKALSIDQPVTQANPANNYLQRELAVDYSNICNVLRNMGNYAESLENGRQALDIFEKMAATDPKDANMDKDLAIMHQNIGLSLIKVNDLASASEHYRTSIRIMEELAAKNPADTDLQLRKEYGYYRLSDLQLLSGDVAHAIENAQHARSGLEPIVAANAKNATAAKYLAVVYTQLGKCHTLLATASSTASNQRVNHWREARDLYQKSLDLYQDMKSKGTLSGADASKPDEITGEIAKCDAALKKLGAG